MAPQVVVKNSYDCLTSPQSTSLPSDFPDAVVFCDIFRASTTLLQLLAMGDRQPDRIYLANDFSAVSAMRAEGALLVSEVYSGGFDNSPTQVAHQDFRKQAIVHKSTNLSNALFHHYSWNFSQEVRPCMFIGGFVNASVMANLLRLKFSRIEIVAASHFARRAEAMEDVLYARYLHRLIVDEAGAVEFLDSHARELNEKIAKARENHTGMASHYWQDIEAARIIDNIPVIGQILPVSGNMRELRHW